MSYLTCINLILFRNKCQDFKLVRFCNVSYTRGKKKTRPSMDDIISLVHVSSSRQARSETKLLFQLQKLFSNGMDEV